MVPDVLEGTARVLAAVAAAVGAPLTTRPGGGGGSMMICGFDWAGASRPVRLSASETRFMVGG